MRLLRMNLKTNLNAYYTYIDFSGSIKHTFQLMDGQREREKKWKI